MRSASGPKNKPPTEEEQTQVNSIRDSFLLFFASVLKWFDEALEQKENEAEAKLNKEKLIEAAVGDYK